MDSASSLSSKSLLFGIESSRNCSTRSPAFIRFRPFKITAAYASVERPRTTTSTSASLYDVLGIRTTATCQEIKQAYRRLARVSHPDVASSGDDKFIRIHSAYATLSDPEKRSDYDRTMLRPASSFEMAAATTTGYRNRRWETDQCW